MTSPDAAHRALASALDAADITAVFQLIFTMQGQCVEFEALSRFANGCPPDVVWDYAERIGVAMLLDRVAIRTAQAQARGLPGKLFLNIRAVHLSAATTLPALGTPDQVVWEVTESHVTDQAGKTGSSWLKQQGYALALDDAGAGWPPPPPGLAAPAGGEIGLRSGAAVGERFCWSTAGMGSGSPQCRGADSGGGGGAQRMGAGAG